MKNCYRIFGLCIVGSLIITIVLMSNILKLAPKNTLYNDFVTYMDNWTYYTNLSNNQSQIKLPWVPECNEKNVTIYMKTKIPDITCNRALLIKSYMKQIKVTINGDEIYNSKINNSKTIIKAIGRGVDFIDVPLRYSGKEIKIEVTSPFPQSQGVIESVSLSTKAAHITNIIKEDGVNNFIAFSIIFVGIVAISIFLVTFLASKRYINLLCIGCFSICCGTWIIGQTDLYQVVYNSPSLGYLFEFVSFYAMPIPLLVFIITTYSLRYEKIIKCLIGIFTVFLVISLGLQLTGILELHQSISLFHIILALSIVILMIILFLEIKRNNGDFLFFFIGCSIMLISGFADLSLFYIKPIKVISGYFNIGMLIFTLVLSISVGKYILRLTHRKIKNEMLMNIAYKDITTGLYNRRSFDEVMEELDKNINYYSNIAIMVVDLDNLKKTNDSEGHAEGDRLILLSSYILKEAYKSVGKAFRIGGDEFVIICENQSPLDIEKCHKKKDLLIDEYRKDTKKNIGMSWGIAFYNHNRDKSIYDVFSRADRNMYKNKIEKKKE